MIPAAAVEAARMVPMPQLVARDRPVKRSGAHYFALCPAHADKTPSFCVYPDHAFCLLPDISILRSDLTRCALGDLRVGDSIIGFDEHAGGRGFGRHYRTAIVEELDI